MGKCSQCISYGNADANQWGIHCIILHPLPEIPANYNRIVRKITSYLSSYVEGTTDTVVEDNVILPQEI